MKIKLHIILLIFLFLASLNACIVEPEIDEEALTDLKSSTWIKAEYGYFYNDNCIKTSTRYFEDEQYVSITNYNFEDEVDTTVKIIYDVIFDTSLKPYKMLAAISSITVNDLDVSGEVEYEFGGTTRDFPEEGDEVYYIFSVQSKKILLLEGSYTDFPGVFSLNYNYYLKKSDIQVPLELAGTTWQRVHYIDQLLDVDLGENCIEYKLRKFTADKMEIYVEYNFEYSADINLLYTYLYEVIDPNEDEEEEETGGGADGDEETEETDDTDDDEYNFTDDAKYLQCKLLSVFYNNEDMTGKTNYPFGQTTADFGFAGDILYSTFIWYEDVFIINDNLLINDPGNEPVIDPALDPGETPGFETGEDEVPDTADQLFFPTGLGNALYTLQESE